MIKSYVLPTLILFVLATACKEKKFAAGNDTVRELKVEVEDGEGSDNKVAPMPPKSIADSTSSPLPTNQSGMPGAGNSNGVKNPNQVATPSPIPDPAKLPSGSGTMDANKVPTSSGTIDPSKAPSGSVTIDPSKVPSGSVTIDPSKVPSGSVTIDRVGQAPSSNPGHVKDKDKDTGSGKGKDKHKDKDKNNENHANNSPKDKTDEVDDDNAEASEEECAKELSVPVHHIKVSGKGHTIKINKNEALFLKVTGNQNTVLVDLTSQPASTSVKAICISVAGGRNKVSVKVGLHVGAIYVKTRGKEPRVEIISTKDSVVDAIAINARKSKGPELFLSGPGKYPCDKASHSIVCSQ